MEHNPDGAPVLISIEDIGPLFGRTFVDEIGDFEVYELAERTSWHRAWRVEVLQVPARLVEPLRLKLNATGAPVDVRIWGAAEPAHYEGKAYGLFDATGAGRTVGITLRGVGAIRRGDWL